MQKFFTGDVVKYTNNSKGFWTIGEIHIISECQYQGNGTFEYTTNKGAWFSDTDFTLVEKASETSLKQLDKDLHLDEE